MGPEGFEPPPTGLKGRHAAATPRPRVRYCLPGFSFDPGHRSALATSLSAIMAPDSNRRSHLGAGESPGFPGLDFPASSPCGNRTHLFALKGRYPWPIDERAGFHEWAGGRSNPRLPGFNRPLDRLSYRPFHSAVPTKTKRPGVFVTPGLRLRTRDVCGRASRPQGIEPERVRRRIGGSLRFLATQDVTRTPGEHERPQCKGYLRPTRLGADLTARPSSCTLTDASPRKDVRAISRKNMQCARNL